MLFTRSAILSVFILNCDRTMNASHDSICTLPNDGTWKITATNQIPRELCGMRDEKIHCGLHFWAICIYQILAESFGVQTLTYMFTPHETYAGLKFLWPKQHPREKEYYM